MNTMFIFTIFNFNLPLLKDYYNSYRKDSKFKKKITPMSFNKIKLAEFKFVYRIQFRFGNFSKPVYKQYKSKCDKNYSFFNKTNIAMLFILLL